jgi:hypothetical protein
MMFLRGVFCLAFFLFSFFDSSYDYVKQADKISSKVTARLAKRHNMIACGGSGGMMDTVNHVGISFQKVGVFSKDEARKIVVDCVEELLRAFNEDEEIRPHLQNYPFTTNNIRVSIFFCIAGGEIYYPDFAVVGLSAGDIVFRASEEGKRQLLTYDEEESYEEALSIVRGEE